MIAETTPEAAALFQQVREWVKEQSGWTTSPELFSEEFLPAHTPGTTVEKETLRIETSESTVYPQGTIYLEPLGRKADGTFVVEMYAWPTLRRVRLIHKPGSEQWKFVTNEDVPLYLEWNGPNFALLARDLTTPA